MKTKNKHTSKVSLMAFGLLVSGMSFSQAIVGTVAPVDTAIQAAAPVVSIGTTYMGTVENYVVIRIAVTQDKAQVSTLKIFDVDGELLHQETIKTKVESRLIKVPPDELKSIRVVYANNSKSTTKLLVINSVTENTYEVSEIAKL